MNKYIYIYIYVYMYVFVCTNWSHVSYRVTFFPKVVSTYEWLAANQTQYQIFFLHVYICLKTYEYEYICVYVCIRMH